MAQGNARSKKVFFPSDEEFGSPKAKGVSTIPGSQLNKNLKEEVNPGDPDDKEATTKGEMDEPEDEKEGSADEDQDEVTILGVPEPQIGPEEDPDLIRSCLQKRIGLYLDDSMIASQLRCSILGLGRGIMEPSRKDVESSPIFQLRSPKDGEKNISNISGLWISLLADSNVLGDGHPKEFMPPKGWPKIYSWETFQKNALEIVSKVWSNQKNHPSLVVVVPPEEAKLSKSYFLDRLHKRSSISQVSIYYEDAGTHRQCRKQYCFCGYCGVVSMNEDSGYSHMRKHLAAEFLCGGCLNFKDPLPKNMGFHLEVCEPCKQARREHGIKESPDSPTQKSKKKRGKKKKVAQ